jgi:RHS repeat-associated protein
MPSAPRGTASTASGDFRTGFAYHETGELKERTIPHAPNQYGSNSLKVEYAINDVGDPTTITDASGDQIVNTFLDGGELRTTNRPSWWTVDGAGVRERSPEEMGGMPEEAELPDSEGHGDLGPVGGQGTPPLLPRAGSAEFQYDDEMRLTGVEDVAGKLVRLDRDQVGRLSELRRPIDATRDYVVDYAYDFNSNLRRITDPEGHDTTFAVDQFDRVIAETRPGSGDDGPDTTEFELDPNGNTTEIETPRGPEWLMTFDAVDRLRSETDPEGGTTKWRYDRAGNRTRKTSPRGNALPEEERGPYRTHWEFNAANEVTKRIDGFGHEWRFEYDLNGNRTKVDAPPIGRNPDAADHRQVTTRTFDGRDLLWTETTGAADNGNDQQRTRVFEFDPNRRLRRIVNPRGVNATTGLPNFGYTADGQVSSDPDAAKHATVYEYEDQSDPTLLTSVRLPWGDRDADDQKRYRQGFDHDGRGRVTAIDPPTTELTPPAAARTTYTHFDTGWIKSASDHWQTFDYDYDKRGLQTAWKVTETRPATGFTREIERLYWPSGALHERSGRKNLGQGVQPEYTYAYEYNRNGLLTLLVDERLDRETEFTYDDADRMLDADESAFMSGEDLRRGKDTRLRYDLDGNVVKRRTDGRIQADDSYAGGKTTEFCFDPLGRETEMEVTADGEATRRTFSEYWPGGELRSRRTERASSSNDTVERWFRFSDGRLSRLDRKRQGAVDFAKNQAYDYDLNGNRIQDERGSHEFNSRDQLVRWTKNGGGQVDYVLNGSGAVTSRTDGSTTTAYHYHDGGERLSHAIVSQGGTSSQTDYSYSQGFGDITSYQVQGAPDPAAEFVYDAFGRLKESKRGANEELYSYDGLDRRDTKQAGGKTFDLSYVGLSESLSQEQQFNGDERRSYDYNSAMERLGTARRTSPTQTAPYRAYSTDAAGSVEGLEDANGEIIGQRYSYDPYGSQLSAESGLDGEAQANPFRFQGHYYDPGQQTYDMRARAYLPEVGRFLQEDHYEQAGGDQLLEADPLTQDRYAFLGGNPVNRIEFDGHYRTTSDQRARHIGTISGDTIDRQTGKVVGGPNAGAGPGGSGFSAPPDPPQQSGEAPITDVSSEGQDPHTDKRLTPRAAPPPVCNLGRGGTPAIGPPGPGCIARPSPDGDTTIDIPSWGEVAGGLCGALEAFVDLGEVPSDPFGGPCPQAKFYAEEAYERGAAATRRPAVIASWLHPRNALHRGVRGILPRGGRGNGGSSKVPGAPPRGGLQNASPALVALYGEGSLYGRSIIEIRRTLVDGGFARQALTQNRKGYLFMGPGGEEVRIMRRSGAWDVRVRNRYGQHLDARGYDPGTAAGSHNITVRSW